MKIKILIATAIIVSVYSCTSHKDPSIIGINTKLTVEIPVVLSGLKSGDLSVQDNGFPFSATRDMDLEQNEIAKPYLNDISSININSVTITVKGLQTGQEVQSLTLWLAGVGEIFTQTGITDINNTFTPDISPDIISRTEAKLMADKKITVTVSGLSNMAIISFSNQFTFDVTINSNAL